MPPADWKANVPMTQIATVWDVNDPRARKPYLFGISAITGQVLMFDWITRHWLALADFRKAEEPDDAKEPDNE